MRALDEICVDYRVIVEEQELDLYAAVIDPAKLLVLDPEYQRNYDAMIDLAPEESRGSGPARNFAWDHARAAGHTAHWTVDDNIRKWLYLNRNVKRRFGDGSVFRMMENFALRYENVVMAGPNYKSFVPRKERRPYPITVNTRIYSCNLIVGDPKGMRWRGRWNEDTILSLDMLKVGWCTILFNAFQQNKLATMTMRGGNTDEIYADGTLRKSQMLVAAHPDVAKLKWRWGRWHHIVDYRPFRGNKLVRREGVEHAPAPELRIVPWHGAAA